MTCVDRAVVTRKAEAGDRPAVGAIATAAYAVYLERMRTNPFSILDDYAEHIRQGHLYVLEEKSVLTGYVVLIVQDSDVALLDNIAVRPDSQKMRCGRCLTLYAKEEGRKRWRRRICLYTNEVMTENIV